MVKSCERGRPCLSRAASDGAAATKAAKRQKVELTVGDKGVFFTTVNTGSLVAATSKWTVLHFRALARVLLEAVLPTQNATFRTCLRMRRQSHQQER